MNGSSTTHRPRRLLPTCILIDTQSSSCGDQRWVWKGMQAVVKKWCIECVACQVSKVTKHTVPTLWEIPVPSRGFTEVSLNIVGLLPPWQGFCYLLTMIDRNTRWLEVAELKDINATTVVAACVRTWVSRYGVPVTLVTDRGSQFTGELWSSMCIQLQISHQTTTAYHSKSNGFIEHFHHSLKAALQAKCQTAIWSAELPLILLGIQSAPRESDAVSSFERTFRVPLILPGEFWGFAETPNQEFLTEFQHSIEVNALPHTLLNWSISPAIPADLASRNLSLFE